MYLNSFYSETGKEWNSLEVPGKVLRVIETMSRTHVCHNAPCIGCEADVGGNNSEARIDDDSFVRQLCPPTPVYVEAQVSLQYIKVL
jgi:hypothetical protein